MGKGKTMAQPHPGYDPYRPLAPQLKWVIVGIVALVLGAWEIAFHLWFMGLPMRLVTETV